MLLFSFVCNIGYGRDEVLGRNCRFLSGMNTDSAMQFQVICFEFIFSFHLRVYSLANLSKSFTDKRMH